MAVKPKRAHEQRVNRINLIEGFAMGKARKRRRVAGRKRKFDVLRERNGHVSRTIEYQCSKGFIDQARERKAAITGRADMPDDVLGILFGHRRIGDDEYNIGRKYGALADRLYGAVSGGGSAMFREAITPPNAEDAERKLEAMSDEDVTTMFMRMDATLRRCGLLIHNVTVAAIRLNRYPQTEEQIGWVVKGLERLAAGHAPDTGTRSILGNRTDEAGETTAGGRVFYQPGSEIVARLSDDDLGVVEMKRVARVRLG